MTAPPGEPAPLRDSEIAAYVDRHGEAMRWAGLTAEETFTDFSTVIRVVPEWARAY